jgi:hypothetical protein
MRHGLESTTKKYHRYAALNLAGGSACLSSKVFSEKKVVPLTLGIEHGS